MTKKNKRKLKIKLKAGVAILVESFVLYNVFGTLATVKAVGIKNTIKEFNSSTYDFMMETDNESLVNLANKYVSTVRIDAIDTNSTLKTLKTCSNLKNIEISNAQRLSYEAINLINKKEIKEIRLIFNREDTIRRIHNKDLFDLDYFKDKTIIKDVSFSLYDSKELDALLFLNYFKNYEETDLYFNDYKYLDDIINEMINNLYIDLGYSEEMDLINCVNIVRQYIEYDPEISSYAKDKTIEEIYNEKNNNLELIRKYNRESLSSVIDPNKAHIVDYSRQVKGVCVNYRDLFTVLCVKLGIECYPLGGIHRDETGSGMHGWNIVKLYDKFFLVDVTNFDSSKKNNQLMDRFIKYDDNEILESLLSNIIIPIDSEIVKRYEPNISIESVIYGIIINLGYKDNIYGTSIPKEIYERNGKLFLSILWLAIYLYVVITKRDKIFTKRRPDKEKKLNL